MTTGGWCYLIHLTNGDVVKCIGDQAIAERHLKQLREQHTAHHIEQHGRPPDTVPYLIGVYPPHTIGGPEGRGGIRSYGYSPTLFGTIDTDPEDWIPA